MKRRSVILIVLFLTLATLGLGAQVRFDVGVDIPRGVGAVVGSNVDTADFSSLASSFFPFPEATVYYRFGEGTVTGGIGLRAFTLIVETIAWPNAFVEVTLGPVAIEAQVGGGLFGLIGIANDVQFGKIFFPDLSAWFKIGKSFRLGAGAMGIFLPGSDVSVDLPFVYYFGAKFTILN